MKDVNFEAAFSRLCAATKSKTDTALAAMLGITAQSVAQAKKKQQIPAQWFIEVARQFDVSTDWLIFGFDKSVVQGEPVPGVISGINEETVADAVGAHKESLSLAGKRLQPMCPHCMELQKKLDVANERLYLASEESKALLKENGEVKTELALLKNKRMPHDINNAVSKVS